MNDQAVIFHNDYVKISDAGIDLTNSGCPYKHLEYKDIHNISVKEGHLIRHSIPIRIIGSLIVIAALVFFIRYISIYPFFQNNGIVSLLLLWRIWPVALVMGIGYLVYQTFIRSNIIFIKTSKSTFSVRIKELENTSELRELEQFLSQKLISSRL